MNKMIGFCPMTGRYRTPRPGDQIFQRQTPTYLFLMYAYYGERSM